MLKTKSMLIKKYIVDDMEEKDMENKKDKYNIDAENNRPRMLYGIPDAIRKKWKEAKAKQDEAKEKQEKKKKVLISLLESIAYL